MSWWGKLLGGTFGYMLGGPLGALLGAALGHQFDRGLQYSQFADAFGASGNRERIQTAFFTSLFSVMGHVAKADGRVSEDEIAMARSVMQQMALTEQQVAVAIDLFNQGKQADFDLDKVLEQFRQECHRRRTLLQMFLEILIHAAYADGMMHPKEQSLLLQISARLGFSAQEFQQLDAIVRGQRTFHGAGGGYEAAAAGKDVLQEAYAVLGVTEQASDTEIKKAYRRLMNQHHPDKLVAKGLPEEMIKIATEKTQEIKAAYDVIRKARGQK